MIKITDIVAEAVSEDEQIIPLLKRGIINLSSYAKTIQDKVEQRTKKKVEVNSIVVALSRLAKKIEWQEVEKRVEVKQLSIQSGLEEISYEKTDSNVATLKEVYSKLPINKEMYFILSQSITEITIIGETNTVNLFRKMFKGEKPKYSRKNLSVITVKFDIKYLDTPNIIYSLIRKLARKHINIVEIVSTPTELTFVVDKKDAKNATAQLTELN